MTIWFDTPNLEQVNLWSKGTMLEHLGIEITEIGEDFIEGVMPADERTFQPYKLVHGGANVVLAESLGSIGAQLTVDPQKYYCVGQEVNANHLEINSPGFWTCYKIFGDGLYQTIQDRKKDTARRYKSLKIFATK